MPYRRLITQGSLVDKLFHRRRKLRDCPAGPVLIDIDDGRFVEGTLKSVAKLRLPYGLPLGLPDRPFWKRLCCGGLPNPTSYVGS